MAGTFLVLTMKASICVYFLLVMLLLATLAQAQSTPVLPDGPATSAVPATVEPVSDTLTPASPSELHTSFPPADLSATTFVAAPPKTKVLDGKFAALGILVFALTAADVELTQYCLNAKTCYEMNPTLPNSRWGQYAVNTVTNLGVMYFSYRRRRAEKWGWWVAPVVDIGAHTAGIGANLRFVH